MRHQKGFTLIELVIVIVILGILAVTAAPRFIDLQSDAKTSTLQGVKAAMQGGSQLVYAKSAISGVQNEPTATVTISGVPNFAVVNGYPDANAILSITGNATPTANLSVFADLEDEGFNILESSTAADNTAVNTSGAADGEFVITFSGDTGAGTCYLRYQNAASNSTPQITVVSDGC